MSKADRHPENSTKSFKATMVGRFFTWIVNLRDDWMLRIIELVVDSQNEKVGCIRLETTTLVL